MYITCKLDPAEGEFLRRQYEDIIPGYYMNKVHWNSVKAEGNVPDALLREMLKNSEYRRLILETSNAIKAVPVWNYFVKPCRL